MIAAQANTARILDGDTAHRRVEEAFYAIREKDVYSTTLERLRVTWNNDSFVKGLPQQLKIGEGLYYLVEPGV